MPNPKYTVVEAKSSGFTGQKLQWVIASDFGGDDHLEVTLVLNNPPRNTFYDKHVLGKGEDPVKILKLRNSMVPYKQEYVQNKDGTYVTFKTKKGKIEKKMREVESDTFDPELANLASGWGIKNTGAPASTVISLKGLNFNQMIFDFANALVAAKRDGKFTAKNDQTDVEIKFSQADSIITVSGAGSVSKGRSMHVGGEWVSGDDDEITFEINHCEGAGADDD